MFVAKSPHTSMNDRCGLRSAVCGLRRFCISFVTLLPKPNKTHVSWRFPVARYLLGILLLVTCGLKLLSMQASTLPQPSLIGSPWLQVTIQWELFLGIWLLSGVHPVAAWRTATGTFLAFAGISGSLGWAGVAKCACFGSPSVSPWFAFTVDLAALALLGISLPKSGINARSIRTMWMDQARPLVWTLIVVGMSVGLAAAGSRWVFGSVDGAIAWLRNEPLSISSEYVDFGSIHSLEARTVTVEVRNWSDRLVRLLGGTSDCSCATSLDLPLTVPPHGSCIVRIRLKVPRSEPGIFSRTLEFWTDDDRQGTLRFQVGCRVVE